MSVVQLVSGYDRSLLKKRIKRSVQAKRQPKKEVKSRPAIDVCVLVRGAGVNVGDRFRMTFRLDVESEQWVCVNYSFAHGRRNSLVRYVLYGEVPNGMRPGVEVNTKLLQFGFDTLYVSVV